MLSRVAERIYWLARYLERIENTARLVSVYDNLLYDLPRGNNISWYNLIIINGGTEQFHERYKVKSERNVVKFLLADDDNYASLLSSIRMLRENVRTSRDVIPSETWELINELYIYVRDNISQGVNRSKRHQFLTHVIESCQMITGLLVGAMTRDAGWYFLILGCNIERADMTTRMLDAGTFLAMEPFEESSVNLTQVIWSKVLRSQSAYLTYRRSVRRAIRASNVVNYLLNDKQFPRTFFYCVEQMDIAAKNLPRSASVRSVLKEIKGMKYVVESSQDLTDDFRSYLNELQIDLIKLNDAIVDQLVCLQRGRCRMTIRVALQHKTSYKFDRLVNIYPHILRLRPAPHSRNHIHSYSLKVTPEQHFVNWQQDPFGNYQARLVFPERIKELKFEVEVIADMTVINPFDFFVESYAEKFPFKYDDQLESELTAYLKVTEDGPLLNEWMDTIDRTEAPINDFLVGLNQRLANEISYGIRLEPGVQTPEETLTLKKGSCRDTSWLLVQILRKLGLAARFASGYLVQLTSDVKSLDGPSGPEEDFTDLHAWCEVYLPGAGWVGLDPTSGLFAGEGHIPLACTPDPASAAPITGATGECEVEFEYSNKVYRIHEDPRVTKPYMDGEWDYINALGKAVDKELKQNDIRLTMGGEPTFVSATDMDSDQWNTGALGADKLRLAKDLLLRLKKRFAPKGVVHYGQGKWYPGEEVPRWALGCYWRKDKQPLWKETRYLARADKDYGYSTAQAKAFGLLLVKLLGVPKKSLRPAYEDTLYYLMQEQSLPEELDPREADLTNDLERRRLARLLTRGLNKPSGYVLPLAWDEVSQSWQSDFWKLRRDLITLIPGDSPMGYRLPLNSLPPMQEHEFTPERDPFEPLEDLAAHGHAESVVGQSGHNSKSSKQKILKPTVRTSLCLEVREGRLHIFLPPMTHLEHYVLLLEKIETVAKKLKLAVILEGYEPPKDPRLVSFQVTPDPGVIEVNIHPSSSWKDLVRNTEVLYKEAHLARLGTEKFMQDGRHTGTGGGNHITLGGATPAESPFLRRPEMLQSFVTYWQHHPGLSYLFSGMFIGPTSQAPRPDEGRDEMLYEMEIAFQQMPKGTIETPWVADRLMRNLLIDITGNTHRSEFCIDKLYAAGTASGRQGILEFRGFEMPPHPHMSLVQALLIRCLLARFWKEPYKKPLVRWGTTLHDKFMLPHFVWNDVKEVVRDLNEHGYPFKLEWLVPFEEFRFPHYGRLQLDDIELELRWAIEPWHVLGEEVSQSGTSRYVDSSVERMQVKLTGMTTDRYVLACNGRRVPVKSTGVKGEYVGAVRFRAWAPPSALHPMLGVDTPLVFDLIDTWNGKSIGGCTYHVSHPGGRSYDNSPVNAYEAEARRISRFWDHGYTQGRIEPKPEFDALRDFFPSHREPVAMKPPVEEPAGEYPHTLDLRKKYTSF